MKKRLSVLFVSTVVLLSLSPVSGLAQGPIHVGDLDAGTTTGQAGKWNATVTVTVHDAGENPVANATVTGSWGGVTRSPKKMFSGSCVTDGSGQCSITLNRINKNSSSVTFSVDDVTHAVDTYSAADNHDPDGDSDGTTIVVLKP
jgi:hypothetical protein